MDEPLLSEEVEIERVVINQPLETTQEGHAAQVHCEGDVPIIPLVEEVLVVEKRLMLREEMRIRKIQRETHTPQEVRLRNKEVHVELRPVLCAATAANLNNFREGTVEMTEIHEEAVVNKEARVVEEVKVRKDVERVRDTVRRTEVDVEQISDGTSRGQDYSRYDAEFRNHFNTHYAQRGEQYAPYQPAYRYGYDLANDSRYQGRQWREVEPEVRRDWESRNWDSAWDDFKESVQYGWDRVRGRA